MADFTEVTKSSWFDRIGKSVGGIIFGVVLFFGSFGLLYWNEGKIDLSKIAKQAVDVSAEKEAPSGADGKLVCIAGKVTSEEVIGDDLFLKASNYLTLSRDSEVYAWVEEKESKTKKDAVGGGETTVTTYKYKKQWVSKAEDTANFNTKGRETYENNNNVDIDNSAANKLVEDESKRVATVKMGRYTMDTGTLDLPG